MPEEPRLGSVARRLAATERVLVVEDEHDIADFLRAYFRAAGYDFVHIDPDTPLGVLDALDEHSPTACSSTSTSAASAAWRRTACCAPTSATPCSR